MGWFDRFTESKDAIAACPSKAPRARPMVEQLETRLVPYAASGNLWPHPELVTVSFVPDGTVLGSDEHGDIVSNMQAAFNARWSTTQWQGEILTALQTWAMKTNVNLDVVSDNGADLGSGLYQQGDAGFGDIRIGGYVFSGSYLAAAYAPPPVNNYSIAGDIMFNTSTSIPWNINLDYDLQTVAFHEAGHSLGLNHNSTLSGAVMYPSYNGIDRSLNADDIAGIRAIYSSGLGRSADGYEGLLGNDTFLTATPVLVNPLTQTSLVTNLDITNIGDTDTFLVVAPLFGTGTMKVKATSAGLSLLRPTVTVYAADQTTVLGSASATDWWDGSPQNVTVTGVNPLGIYYVKVTGTDSTQFSRGKYALTLNFGSGSSPTIPKPNTQTLNGNPISGGGAQALLPIDRLLQAAAAAGLAEEGLGIEGLAIPKRQHFAPRIFSFGAKLDSIVHTYQQDISAGMKKGAALVDALFTAFEVKDSWIMKPVVKALGALGNYQLALDYIFRGLSLRADDAGAKDLANFLSDF